MCVLWVVTCARSRIWSPVLKIRCHDTLRALVPFVSVIRHNSIKSASLRLMLVQCRDYGCVVIRVRSISSSTVLWVNRPLIPSLVSASASSCPRICIPIELRRTLIHSCVLFGRGCWVYSLRLLSSVLSEGTLSLAHVHTGEAALLTALGQDHLLLGRLSFGVLLSSEYIELLLLLLLLLHQLGLATLSRGIPSQFSRLLGAWTCTHSLIHIDSWWANRSASNQLVLVVVRQASITCCTIHVPVLVDCTV